MSTTTTNMKTKKTAKTVKAGKAAKALRLARKPRQPKAKSKAKTPAPMVARAINTSGARRHLQAGSELMAQAMHEISLAHTALDQQAALAACWDRDLVSAMRELFQAFHLARRVQGDLTSSATTTTSNADTDADAERQAA